MQAHRRALARNCSCDCGLVRPARIRAAAETGLAARTRLGAPGRPPPAPAKPLGHPASGHARVHESGRRSLAGQACERRGGNGSDPVAGNPPALGGAAVVELDVIESHQHVLHERQARKPDPRVVDVRVVEQQDRPGAVGLEKDVSDQAFLAQLGDLVPFSLKMRPDVLAGPGAR